MRARVAAGDSWEGLIQYGFPWLEEMGDPSTDADRDGFRVEARYRVGNLQGQGGMVMVGEVEES